MQHGDVWRALDEIAQRSGLSPSGLARLAGLDATAFNKSKRISKEGRPRWPSTESISRALDAAQVDYTEFAGLVSGRFGQSIPYAAIEDVVQSDLFTMSGAPDAVHWDEIDVPGFAQDVGCFVLEVTTSAYAPVYRRGDLLLVSRLVDVRSNDRVVVRTSSGAVLLGLVDRSTSRRLHLKALMGQSKPKIIELAKPAWTARILWASQ